MSETHCPLCYSVLEIADVAPCMECGNLSEEIEHALAGKHTYAEMRIFDDLTLVLCDFCQVDFGSFNPEFFGLPRDTRIGYEKMQFIGSVEEVRIGKDKVCPSCKYRLPFLKFMQRVREMHGHGKTGSRA
jgi:hypothetical protein